jgi:hypothetical protein
MLTARLTVVPFATFADGGSTVQTELGGKFVQANVTSPVKL